MTRAVNTFLILSFLAAACAAGSCSRDQGAFQDNIEELRGDLESGRYIPGEAQPAERTFEPVLDGKWIGNAVAYGCYRSDQAPGLNGPTEAQILEDLTIITRYWNLIRVYSSDDDTERILRVIDTHELPLRIMLGVWLENEEGDPGQRRANVEQVLRGIALAHAYPGIIAAVCVGNETQVSWSAHRMNGGDLIRYLRAVRNHTSVPVTSADDYAFWITPESKQVAEEIDFVVTHIYPLWNGKTLQAALGWMDQMYRAVQDAHPQRRIVIGETGWATTYNPAKKGPGQQGTLIRGEVSIQAQETFLFAFNEWVNRNRITAFLFEAFDEPWKGGGDDSAPEEIEKHWGVFYENRTPKESFRNYLNRIHNLSG